MGYLEDRLLECFPSGNYALVAFLRLTDIVESDRVPTAAVECKVQPRLLINREFVDKHAETSEKLLMLVMHELHHVLLGHTTLFPTATRAQNFVFDCVINALLSRMFHSSSYTSFFTDLYSDTRFPECFLRPPNDWDGRQVERTPSGLARCEKRNRSTFQELYRTLYSDTGVSYHEIYRLMSKHLATCAIGIPLLGGHGSEGKEGHLEMEDGDQGIDSTKPDLPSNSPVLFDIVREIVEKWPQPPDPVKGRSLSDLLRETKVNPTSLPDHAVKLRNLLRWLGRQGLGGNVRSVAVVDAFGYSAIPGFARRDLILQSIGQTPLLFTQSIVTKQRVAVSEKVHVYVDVSGSMRDVIEAVYGAVRACHECVYPLVHLFSTEVADVSYRDFSQGKRMSTNGTDIACVAQHIKSNDVTRACVVTDGYVGQPNGEELQTFSKIRLGVVFVGDSNSHDLASVIDKSVEIKV